MQKLSAIRDGKYPENKFDLSKIRVLRNVRLFDGEKKHIKQRKRLTIFVPMHTTSQFAMPYYIWTSANENLNFLIAIKHPNRGTGKELSRYRKFSDDKLRVIKVAPR